MDDFGQCSIELDDVVRAMNHSESISVLLQNWRRFSSILKISPFKIMDLQSKLNLGTVEFIDMPREILTIWIAENGEHATLQSLRGALVECKATDIAESLLSKLITPEYLKIVTPQGKLVSLKEVHKQDEEWKNFVDRPIRIINSSSNSTSQPAYYIPRRCLVIAFDIVLVTLISLCFTAQMINTRNIPAADDAVEQGSVKDIKFIWQGNVTSLQDLLGENASAEFYQRISNISKRPLGEKPQEILNKRILPTAPPIYYVPRTLLFVNRTEIDPKLFLSDAAKNHIFLFKGSNKTDLGRLTKYEHQIGSSTNFQMNQTARFILLVYDGDYDSICRETNTPVHVILQEGGQYFWVKSNKDLDVIRRFKKKPKHCVLTSEQDIITRIGSVPAPSSFCIADSPGMGKTFLLTKIAYAVQQEQPLSITLFIVLQEFVMHLSLNQTTAIDAVAEYASCDIVTKLVLLKMMTTCDVYLFLDGYDEVTRENSVLFDTLLSQLRTVKNFKIIVTSRSHVQEQLENVLGRLSYYEILPFTKQNQLEFLGKYWVDKHGAKDGHELDKFAQKCLTALEHNLGIPTFSFEDENFVGIPLQCMMLAEVYAEHAERASRLQTLADNDYGYDDDIKPFPFVDMFPRLFEIKFQRAPGKDYKRYHVFEAIKLLFPEWVEYFSSIIDQKSNPINEDNKSFLSKFIEYFSSIVNGNDKTDETIIYSIGLLEKGPNENTPRFIHRTFAEFLLAEFVVDNLGKHFQCVELFVKILMWDAWWLSEEDEGWHNTGVIIYFIEMNLKEHASDEMLIPNFSVSKKFNKKPIYHALESSVEFELEATLDYFAKLLHHLDLVDNETKFFEDLVRSVVTRCENVRMLEKVFELANQIFGNSNLCCHFSDKAKTPLHIAVRSGNWNMVLLLVQNCGDEVSKLKLLLHECVKESADDSDDVVEDKQIIIVKLTSLNGSWLDEMDEDGRTPLLQNNVHLKLLERLLHNGADITAVTSSRESLLHLRPELVEIVLSQGFSGINSRDEIGRTPFMCYVERFGIVDDKVLKMYHDADADLNAEDIYGDSVLFYAIKHTADMKTVQKLRQLGANVTHRNKVNQNALHMTVQGRKMSVVDKLQIIDMLVGVNPDLINEKDQGGCTPLLTGVECFGTRDDLELLLRLYVNALYPSTIRESERSYANAVVYGPRRVQFKLN